jgi:ornithine cyclodeaminase/alanine dehydrogenase-like protein (mu-crystallin family)
MKAQFFSDEIVSQRLPVRALINKMEEVLKDVSLKRVEQPLRTVHEIDQQGSLLFLKPVLTSSVIAVKVITQMPGNNALGLPSMAATLLVMDRLSGELRSVMQATSLTNLRTAAVSAVAVRHLTSNKPLKLAILGSGALARTHATAIGSIRVLESIRVWSPTEAHRTACALAIGGVPAATAQLACDDADIIVTVTLANQPILKVEWVKPGALICAVGAPRPSWRELDTPLMQSAIVLADSRSSAECESGDILLSGAKVFAELGEILLGTKVITGRPTIVFKSLGLAAEDAGAAELVMAAGDQSA